jgi:hypothetical protein
VEITSAVAANFPALHNFWAIFAVQTYFEKIFRSLRNRKNCLNPFREQNGKKLERFGSEFLF